MDKNPAFALEVGLTALRWLDENYGDEVTGADVWSADSHTIDAAERVGRRDEVRQRIRRTHLWVFQPELLALRAIMHDHRFFA